MTRSMVAKLIATDLRFNRWLIALGIAGGISSMALIRLHSFIGLVAFITVVVVCYIFIALRTKRERTEKHALFILSLPISPAQYTAAKVAAATVSFLIVWVALLAVGLLASQSANDGSVFPALMTLLLVNFFIMLAVGVITTSELWTITALILTNTSVPLFFSVLSEAQARQAQGGWPPSTLTLLTAAGLVIVLCLVLIAYTQSRRRDFV